MRTDALPDSVEELQRLVLLQQSQIETYKEKSEQLEEEVKLLRRLRFAQKSEKWTAEDKQQSLLFDEAESDTAEHPNKPSPSMAVKGHRRKARGRKPLDESLPRKEVLHDLPDNEKKCECGHELKRIGEDSYEELEFEPARYWVNKHIYPKYACKQCESSSNEEKPAVRSAVRTPRIIEKSIATPSLLAYLLVGKFEDHLPFYRQERIFRRLGVELTRATMSNWSIHIGKQLAPLLEIMRQDMLSGPLIAADETPLQVMKEPGRDNSAKSYMWLFRGGETGRPIVMYNYRPTRAGSVATEFLQGYRGILLTDGYAGYNEIGRLEQIIHVGCWAHVRRKFKEAFDAGQQATGVASHVLGLIQELYKIESSAREDSLVGAGLSEYRQKNSRPVVDALYKYLNEEMPKVRPQSLTGKAIAYALGEWPRLIHFLEYAVLPLDNNAAEKSIRPFVLGRKNWLFFGSLRGACASTAIYSIIETAKANGLEAYWYLRYLLERLPHISSPEQLDEIAPHRIEMATISDYKGDGKN